MTRDKYLNGPDWTVLKLCFWFFRTLVELRGRSNCFELELYFLPEPAREHQ
jgi:hypothetical protein